MVDDTIFQTDGASDTRREYLKRLGVIGLAGGIAGCSGDGGSNSDGGSGDGGSNSDGGSGDGGSGAQTTWLVGANPTDSPVYTWNTGFAKIADQHVDGLSLELRTDQGHLPTMRTVSTGDKDAGATSTSAYWAGRQGLDPFKQALKTPAQYQSPVIATIDMFLATSPDSDIETVEDLAGKTYSYVARGGATNPTNAAILEEAGVRGKVKEVYQGHTETRSAVAEGRVDAFQCFLVDGFTLAGPYIDLANQMGGIKVIKVPAEIRKKVLMKGWAQRPRPTKAISDVTFTNVDTIDTIGYGVSFVVNQDNDEELVYQFTKAMIENQKQLDEIHPSFKTFGFGDSPMKGFDKRAGFSGIDPEAEFHPGAKRYYKEAGHPLPGE